ncbi:beta-lactamase class A [Moorella thermoacetica Y72]|uniref:Beta-lactamase class A n=1 Tax=Moorella thermoacetica Y72 TaxID=1325331 RepID=A0A0S6U9K7_NEOTH|nr:beta-lactamase class A [Moorella thermoacetica Y72]
MGFGHKSGHFFPPVPVNSHILSNNTLQVKELVFHALQAESTGRGRRSCLFPGTGRQDGRDSFRHQATAADLHQCTDHNPDHMVEETIGYDVKIDKGAVLTDAGLLHLPLKVAHRATGGAKGAEIVATLEVSRRPGHGCYIEGLPQVPAITAAENIGNAIVIDGITIPFSSGAIASMEIRRHLHRLQGGNVCRQNAVQGQGPALHGYPGPGTKADYLPPGMDPGVGSPGSYRSYFLPGQPF